MKKFTDIDSLVADTAERKQRAARARAAGNNTPDAEAPRVVYRDGCATVAAALARDGFRFVKSGPRARRPAGNFLHSVTFQSSHNNVAGEHVALWIFVGVACERLAKWREAAGEGSSDALAGGQVGNLESPPGWREWDLANRERRSATLEHAVETVRAVALPFFAQFEEPLTTLSALRHADLVGLEPISAIQFALAYDGAEIARVILQRFLHVRSDLRPAYDEHIAEYSKSAPPRYWNMGYAKDLAKATVLYGLAERA